MQATGGQAGGRRRAGGHRYRSEVAVELTGGQAAGDDGGVEAPPRVRNEPLDPKLAGLIDETPAEEKGFLYCAACSHVLGRTAAATTVNGSHTHHCTNPYGFEFHIGCFREALGCDISGQPEAADSWFAGYHWRYASCGGCTQHLGWYFEREEHYFYGLVLDRIEQS